MTVIVMEEKRKQEKIKLQNKLQIPIEMSLR
jgi:hypothetical protein